MTALDLADPVAVVGTGTMGQGIAQVALVAGHPVRLYDAVPGRARAAAEAIGARLDRLVEKGRLSGGDRHAARARLCPAESLSELAGSNLVVEAVLERLDVKQQLFRELEEAVSDDCLPLALDYRRATRIALCASQDTRQQTLVEATGLFQALGKDVSVIGDAPGMIVARTVARIVDLAHDAVSKGVATEEDVDTAMRLGVNYPLGPFEWGRRLGRVWAHDLLEELHLREPSGRYAPSLALYRHGHAADKREGTT